MVNTRSNSRTRSQSTPTTETEITPTTNTSTSATPSTGAVQKVPNTVETNAAIDPLGAQDESLLSNDDLQNTIVSPNFISHTVAGYEKQTNRNSATR